MRHFLKMAWTVFFVVITVMLCVLWARSYSFHYIMQGGNALGFFRADSFQGIGKLMVATPQKQAMQLTFWSLKHDATEPLPIDLRGFYLKIGKEFVSVGAPDWFHILITSLLTIVPWIGWSNRFSLRTMLIVTTLVAVALGLIVISTQR
jgi:hypothetical protein